MIDEEIAVLADKARQAARSGNPRLAGDMWNRILAKAPTHAGALLALAQLRYRGGALDEARSLLERLVAVDGSDQQQWINLAVVCLGLNDEAGEERAIRGALTVAPSDLLGLLLRASLLERQGKMHAAATAYGAAASVAPPMDQLKPELRPSVARARAYKEEYDTRFSAFLDSYLAPHFSQAGGDGLDRFRDSVDIMFGRKKRYDSQSMLYHYPGLAPISFFKRDEFPWLDAMEAQTEAIRNEFLQVLASEEGFAPYLTYSPDQPLNQWAELNNSLRWSAFHLYQGGLPVAANVERCPITMATLAGAPMPDQPGRTPSAMFSLLKPHTRIPPHVGASNARLVVHLPLLVPPGCGFRVGNDTREWVPGKAWVFDDTIEHEAWNDSAQLRVVLIFDIWHPHLSQAERTMIAAMSRGIDAFSQGEGGFGL
ncbi:MAG: aspartyl/asparaginyl beta-hydroxylase domain-containing protein [Terriglobales bacterium]